MIIVENIMIPLDLISYVEILKQGKLGYGRMTIAFFVGAALIFIPHIVMPVVGIVSFATTLYFVISIF